MKRIVIVRHGNTFQASEPPRRIGARTDLPLTAEGRNQARTLGESFRDGDIRFARALTSPMSRTRQTAELVLASQALAPTLQTAAWLVEIDHGIDEGKGEAQVIARVGQVALAAWDHRGIPPPGWPVDAAACRESWRILFAAACDGNTLVVTSSGVARFALLAAVANALPPSLRLRTGAFGIIALPSDGPPMLEAWDRRP